jgi:hypothetical protein
MEENISSSLQTNCPQLPSALFTKEREEDLLTREHRDDLSDLDRTRHVNWLSFLRAGEEKDAETK